MLHRDFSDASILDDFSASLERSLRGQLTDSGLYMGMHFPVLFPSFLIVKLFRDKFVGIVRLLSCDGIEGSLTDATLFILSGNGRLSLSKL